MSRAASTSRAENVARSVTPARRRVPSARYRSHGEEKRGRDGKREIAWIDALVPLLEQEQVRGSEKRNDRDTEEPMPANARQCNGSEAEGEEQERQEYVDSVRNASPSEHRCDIDALRNESRLKPWNGER